MAKMHPASDQFNPETPNSEKRVYAALAKLPDEWHVFHSVVFAQGSAMGEGDFVLVHELKGVAVLEVKGGGIHSRDGAYYSTNDEGDVFSIKNPLKQASRLLYFLKDLHAKHIGEAQFNYTPYVCLPDCRDLADVVSKDLNPLNTFCHHDLASLHERIDREFTARGGNVMAKSSRDFFLNLLKENYSIPLSIAMAIESQNDRYRQMDLMQDYLLELFEDKRKIAFRGAAGTGKTWVAMKKARRLAAAGESVLFLCYNAALADMVSSRLADTPVTVRTYHSFAQSGASAALTKLVTEEVLRTLARMVSEIRPPADDSGEKPQKEDKQDKPLEKRIEGFLRVLMMIPGGSYTSVYERYADALDPVLLSLIQLLIPTVDDPKHFYHTGLPLFLMEAQERGLLDDDDRRFTALIIDEGQDFNNEYCSSLEKIFDSFRERIVWIFYDVNQSIFGGKSELPVKRLIGSGSLTYQLYDLKENLRNTRAIHSYAVNATGLGNTAHAGEVDGLQVSEYTAKNAEDTASRIGAILDEIVNANRIDKERIVVLGNRSYDHSCLKDRAVGQWKLIKGGEGKQKNALRYRTIHSFKGLEEDIVILVYESVIGEEDQHAYSSELFYVGLTRARHLLYVIKVNQR